jgi:hypothetical protein
MHYKTSILRWRIVEYRYFALDKENAPLFNGPRVAIDNTDAVNPKNSWPVTASGVFFRFGPQDFCLSASSKIHPLETTDCLLENSFIVGVWCAWAESADSWVGK